MDPIHSALFPHCGHDVEIVCVVDWMTCELFCKTCRATLIATELTPRDRQNLALGLAYHPSVPDTIPEET